ncbi:methylated-DNA--[protein]-cysteine S-methyltransferase [Myxococcota bacterium]|nr:methylated-DNA--[protein]-cysteine S-methyltransferase [Myxococcota bacterium]
MKTQLSPLDAAWQTLHKAGVISPDASMASPEILITLVDSPLGPLLLGAVTKGLVLCSFFDDGRALVDLGKIATRLRARVQQGESPFFTSVQVYLEAYFAGEIPLLDVPLILTGTPFQVKAWDYLLTIPHGETRSYAQQAVAVENPRGVRAVAQANGRNPLPVLVPCHRVVGSDGTLTGYSSGLWRKRSLLILEGALSEGAQRVHR